MILLHIIALSSLKQFNLSLNQEVDADLLRDTSDLFYFNDVYPPPQPFTHLYALLEGRNQLYQINALMEIVLGQNNTITCQGSNVIACMVPQQRIESRSKVRVRVRCKSDCLYMFIFTYYKERDIRLGQSVSNEIIYKTNYFLFSLNLNGLDKQVQVILRLRKASQHFQKQLYFVAALDSPPSLAAPHQFTGLSWLLDSQIIRLTQEALQGKAKLFVGLLITNAKFQLLIRQRVSLQKDQITIEIKKEEQIFQLAAKTSIRFSNGGEFRLSIYSGQVQLQAKGGQKSVVRPGRLRLSSQVVEQLSALESYNLIGIERVDQDKRNYIKQNQKVQLTPNQKYYFQFQDHSADPAFLLVYAAASLYQHNLLLRHCVHDCHTLAPHDPYQYHSYTKLKFYQRCEGICLIQITCLNLCSIQIQNKRQAMIIQKNKFYQDLLWPNQTKVYELIGEGLCTFMLTNFIGTAFLTAANNLKQILGMQPSQATKAEVNSNERHCYARVWAQTLTHFTLTAFIQKYKINQFVSNKPIKFIIEKEQKQLQISFTLKQSAVIDVNWIQSRGKSSLFSDNQLVKSQFENRFSIDKSLVGKALRLVLQKNFQNLDSDQEFYLVLTKSSDLQSCQTGIEGHIPKILVQSKVCYQYNLYSNHLYELSLVSLQVDHPPPAVVLTLGEQKVALKGFFKQIVPRSYRDCQSKNYCLLRVMISSETKQMVSLMVVKKENESHLYSSMPVGLAVQGKRVLKFECVGKKDYFLYVNQFSGESLVKLQKLLFSFSLETNEVKYQHFYFMQAKQLEVQIECQYCQIVVSLYEEFVQINNKQKFTLQPDRPLILHQPVLLQPFLLKYSKHDRLFCSVRFQENSFSCQDQQLLQNKGQYFIIFRSDYRLLFQIELRKINQQFSILYEPTGEVSLQQNSTVFLVVKDVSKLSSFYLADQMKLVQDLEVNYLVLPNKYYQIISNFDDLYSKDALKLKGIQVSLQSFSQEHCMVARIYSAKSIDVHYRFMRTDSETTFLNQLRLKKTLAKNQTAQFFTYVSSIAAFTVQIIQGSVSYEITISQMNVTIKTEKGEQALSKGKYQLFTVFDSNESSNYFNTNDAHLRVTALEQSTFFVSQGIQNQKNIRLGVPLYQKILQKKCYFFPGRKHSSFLTIASLNKVSLTVQLTCLRNCTHSSIIAKETYISKLTLHYYQVLQGDHVTQMCLQAERQAQVWIALNSKDHMILASDHFSILQPEKGTIVEILQPEQRREVMVQILQCQGILQFQSSANIQFSSVNAVLPQQMQAGHYLLRSAWQFGGFLKILSKDRVESQSDLLLIRQLTFQKGKNPYDSLELDKTCQLRFIQNHSVSLRLGKLLTKNGIRIERAVLNIQFIDKRHHLKPAKNCLIGNSSLLTRDLKIKDGQIVQEYLEFPEQKWPSSPTTVIHLHVEVDGITLYLRYHPIDAFQLEESQGGWVQLGLIGGVLALGAVLLSREKLRRVSQEREGSLRELEIR